MSNMMSRFAASNERRETVSLSALPSPGTIFSDTASMRWVDAISVVRSGVTKPRRIARPASASSAAIRMSTSPGDGLRDSDRLRTRRALARGIIST